MEGNIMCWKITVCELSDYLQMRISWGICSTHDPGHQCVCERGQWGWT